MDFHIHNILWLCSHSDLRGSTRTSPERDSVCTAEAVVAPAAAAGVDSTVDAGVAAAAAGVDAVDAGVAAAAAGVDSTVDAGVAAAGVDAVDAGVAAAAAWVDSTVDAGVAAAAVGVDTDVAGVRAAVAAVEAKSMSTIEHCGMPAVCKRIVGGLILCSSHLQESAATQTLRIAVPVLTKNDGFI